MNPRHEIFVREILLHGDKQRAYVAAYPGASGQSLRAAASRLYNRKDIKEAISAIQNRVRQSVMEELESQMAAQLKAEILSTVEKRKFLAGVVRGHCMETKHVCVNRERKCIEVPPRMSVRLRALEIDARMAGELPPVRRRKSRRFRYLTTSTVSDIPVQRDDAPAPYMREADPLPMTETASECAEVKQTVTKSAEAAVMPPRRLNKQKLWQLFLKYYPYIAALPANKLKQKQLWFYNKTQQSCLSYIIPFISEGPPQGDG